MPEFTFANGTVVTYRAVPSLLIRKFVMSIPEPEPPRQTIDGVEYTNTSSPDYKLALEQHRIALAERVSAFLLEYAVTLDTSAYDVAAYRKEVSAFGISLDEYSDKQVVLMFILPDGEEWAHLVNAIQSASVVSRSDIEAAKKE